MMRWKAWDTRCSREMRTFDLPQPKRWHAHPDEGYNMLKDAAEIDNLLTRRAAVFGLARIPEEWALALLEHVQMEDDQWVVRGAAAEAAERRRVSPYRINPPLQKCRIFPG